MPVTLAISCGPRTGPEPRLCSDEVIGTVEDWQSAEVPAGVPACVAPIAEPLALCVNDESDLAGAAEVDLHFSGSISALGVGAPPTSCYGFGVVGRLVDLGGQLVPPPEQVRWIAVDGGGLTRVIALAAAENNTQLAVGDHVDVRVSWDSGRSHGRTRLEVRDEGGEILWWFVADSTSDPLEATPGCESVRLGAPRWLCPDPCTTAQHHAVEVGDATVEPGESAVVGDFRFTNGAAWITDGQCERDHLARWRMLAATREG